MIDTDIREVFGSERWTDVTAEIPQSTVAFVSRDMFVVAVVADNAGDAAEAYPEVQQRIKEVRLKLTPPPDCYLLLVVPDVGEDDYTLLRRALDDTLVCRKIVVPLRGRSAADALRRQFPFVDDEKPYAVETSLHDNSSGTGPTDEDLDLLDRNSPANIVQHLLDAARERLREST